MGSAVARLRQARELITTGAPGWRAEALQALGEAAALRELALSNRETLASEMANNDSFEKWEEEGSLTSAERANRKWKQMLRDYEAPPLDSAIDEELCAYIAKRKSEMADASY